MVLKNVIVGVDPRRAALRDPTERHVLLVMCGRRKRSRPSKAENLYTSPFFKAAKDLAREHGFKWFILSAKHGLLAPGAVISPYDLSLRELRESERQDWGRRVVRKLKPAVPRDASIIVVATKEYFGPLRVPLRALGMPHRFLFVWNTSALTISQARRVLRQRLIHELTDSSPTRVPDRRRTRLKHA